MQEITVDTLDAFDFPVFFEAELPSLKVGSSVQQTSFRLSIAQKEGVVFLQLFYLANNFTILCSQHICISDAVTINDSTSSSADAESVAARLEEHRSRIFAISGVFL